MRDKKEEWIEKEIENDRYRMNWRAAQAFRNRISEAERQKKVKRYEAKADHEYDIYRAAEIEYEHDPITEVPDTLKLPKDYFEEVEHKVEYNQIYADYYMQRYEDTNLEKYKSMSERLSGCHKSWFGDRYKQAGIFNVKRVFHCHNRWCWLCTHIKQAKRLCKFETMFEKLSKENDLYHLVFTVPNVKGEVLKKTLTKMQSALRRIIKYFQGFEKISGLDFEHFGFSGAVRSFEIVIYPTEYHPHLHVLFMLKKGLELKKTELNKFSFSKESADVRPFSKLEIILQKVFYLAVNGQKINLKSIENLGTGYSCMMDCIEDDRWKEVFKYATKMSKDGASACTYKQFVLLDDILRSMRVIEGYGVFKGIDNKIDENDPTAEILFEKVLIMLNKRETPERDVHLELDKLVDELHHNNMTVISKRMSYKYLQAIVDDLRAEFKLTVEDGFEPF